MVVFVYMCMCGSGWQLAALTSLLWCIFCCLFCFWSFLFTHLPQAANLFCLFYSSFVYVKVNVKPELWFKILPSLSAFLLTREPTHSSLYLIHAPYLSCFFFSVRIFLSNIFIFIYWEFHTWTYIMCFEQIHFYPLPLILSRPFHHYTFLPFSCSFSNPASSFSTASMYMGAVLFTGVWKTYPGKRANL